MGLDFGTESARAILVGIATGETLTTAASVYADGAIDETLLGTEELLPPDWALQNPANWLAALQTTIPAVLTESSVNPASVVGLGLDFTACTILPTTVDGTPLYSLDVYRERSHAWVKLWKHHAAQPQADRVNELASAKGESWPTRYGG